MLFILKRVNFFLIFIFFDVKLYEFFGFLFVRGYLFFRNFLLKFGFFYRSFLDVEKVGYIVREFSCIMLREKFFILRSILFIKIFILRINRILFFLVILNVNFECMNCASVGGFLYLYVSLYKIYI